MKCGRVCVCVRACVRVCVCVCAWRLRRCRCWYSLADDDGKEKLEACAKRECQAKGDIL